MKMLRLNALWVVSFFAALCLFLTVEACHASGSHTEAKVLSFEGHVQRKTPSWTQWKNVQKNEILARGDQILTGPNSTCEIGVGEGTKSVVKLRADSKAALTSLDPVKIDLESGKVLSWVRGMKPGSTFQVSTPTAIAAVRGTGWEQGAHAIKVFEATVYLTGAGGQASDVPEGKGLAIGDDGKLGALFDVSNGDLDEWNEFKEKATADLELTSHGASGSAEGGFGGDNHDKGDGSSNENLSVGSAGDTGDIKALAAGEKNTDEALSTSRKDKDARGDNGGQSVVT